MSSNIPVVLVVFTDGHLSDSAESAQTLVAASYFPLSITCVGIGDSNFAQYTEFDDSIFSRQFDNFHFSHLDYWQYQDRQVCATTYSQLLGPNGVRQFHSTELVQATLLRLNLLAELPQQWTLMNDMGYFELTAEAD